MDFSFCLEVLLKCKYILTRLCYMVKNLWTPNYRTHVLELLALIIMSTLLRRLPLDVGWSLALGICDHSAARALVSIREQVISVSVKCGGHWEHAAEHVHTKIYRQTEGTRKDVRECSMLQTLYQLWGYFRHLNLSCLAYAGSIRNYSHCPAGPWVSA